MAKAWRVIEYEGDPEWLAVTLSKSIHGVYSAGSKGIITEIHREVVDGKNDVDRYSEVLPDCLKELGKRMSHDDHKHTLVRGRNNAEGNADSECSYESPDPDLAVS
jgi:hypothetical protein